MFDKSATNEESATQSPVSLVDQPAQPQAAAVIGESIVIKGEITGEQSLVINGRVEGSVNLPQHDLQVGPTGTIKANMSANEVQINGEVNGDITGVEKVTVSKDGRVQGNIVAPRVTLEDGAKFKGSIDMDPSEKSAATAEAPVEAPADQAEAVKQALREVRKKSSGEAAASTASKG